jgi:hypothetical protein
MDPEDY